MTMSACYLARGFALIPAVSHGSRVVCVVKSKRVQLLRELDALCIHCLFLARDKHELNVLDSQGDGLCSS